MTAIGMGLAFGAYTLGIWGYCLIRGYNVTFGDLFGQTWIHGKVSTSTPGQVVLPGGHKLGQFT